MKRIRVGAVLAAVCAAGLALGWVAATTEGEPVGGDTAARFVLVQDMPRGGAAPGGGGEAAEQRMRERSAMVQASGVFRTLDDAIVRSEIGLTAEQEARIAELQKKVQTTFERIRDRVNLDFGAEDPTEDLSPEEQRERRRERFQAWAEAFRGARPELEAMMKEAMDMLSEEQLAKLREIGEQRSTLGEGNADLWILATTRVKADLGLTDEQVTQIREILKETGAKLAELRKTTFTRGEEGDTENRVRNLRERIDAFRKSQTDIGAETRQRVLDVLDADQRAKAEELLTKRDEQRKAKAEQLRNQFGVGGAPGGEGPPGQPGFRRGPPGEGGRREGPSGERGYHDPV